MRPESKAVLAGVLDYHIVPGRLTATDLAARIEAGGGKTTLTTAGGQDISLSMSGNKILLTAAGGNRAVVSAADLRSEEHTSELQSPMRIAYAVFRLKQQ